MNSEKMPEKRVRKAPSIDLFQARSIAQSESTDRTASFKHGQPEYEEDDHIRRVDELEANSQLGHIKENHKWDPNLPADIEEEIQEAALTTDAARRLSIVESIVNDSPYPEVRAAVRNVRLSLPLLSSMDLLMM